jgi:uncharacterized protein with von Willebrand factor type A (vWA) domain
MTNKTDQATQVVYVDRPVVHHVETSIASEPQVIFQDREVIKEVPVEVEKVIIQKEVEKVDLSEVHAHLAHHHNHLLELQKHAQLAADELEMQRRALVGLKAQRDIDRSRRLMFIKRVKKERDTAKKLNLKLKLAIGVSLLMSLVSLLMRH